MKKIISLILVLSFLLMGGAFSEELLPELEEVFGQPMPSLYSLLKRYPDAIGNTETGLEETWEGISEADYTAFGEYLSASGCEMLGYTSENGIFQAEVGKAGRTYHFIFDADGKRATLVFPAGTYDEALYDTEQLYQKAMVMIDEGEYRQACVLLSEIRGYRDADTIMESDENIHATAWRTPGCVVTFGVYEQDNDAKNGAEPIEWLVLDSDEETTMLISRYALDCKAYNDVENTITWETSTLRMWLNDAFLNVAFSDGEQKRLETVTVKADKNPDFDTDSGNDTQDRVFLLSIDEVNRYFASDDARICIPTKLTVDRGVNKNSSGTSWWWLRSPGFGKFSAADVDNIGSVNSYGIEGNRGHGAVRPVVIVRHS